MFYSNRKQKKYIRKYFFISKNFFLIENLNYSIFQNIFFLKGRNGTGKTTVLNNLNKNKNIYIFNSNKKIKDLFNYIFNFYYIFNLNLLKEPYSLKKSFLQLSYGNKKLIYYLLNMLLLSNVQKFDELFNGIDKFNYLKIVYNLLKNKQNKIIPFIVDHSHKITFKNVLVFLN